MDYKDIIVKSVGEYLNWLDDSKFSTVTADKGEDFDLESFNTYYRGQSCSTWELKPSVLREPPYLNEHALLSKASLRLWNEISSLKTYIEKMIFFQHYGLSTRLLDVTFNPLVALYMACCEEDKYSCDGVVFCGRCTGKINSRIAELTAKYIFENELQRELVSFHQYVKKEMVNVKDFTQPIFILPPINNPRIEAQNGAFIMAPLIEEEFDEDMVPLNKKSLNNTEFFDDKRAIIRGCDKENIMHELSVYGIDSGTIYKGIEEKLRAIVTEEIWESNRYKNIQL